MRAVSQSPIALVQRRERRRAPTWLWGYGLCLPAFAVVFALLLYPLVFDIWISFTDAANFQASGSFVGLANYGQIFSDPAYWSAAASSVVLMLGTAIVEVVIGLLTALLLWWRFWGRSIVFLAVFVPWAVPSPLAAFSWFWLFLPPFHSFYTLQAISAKLWLNAIFGIGSWHVLSLAVMNVWRGSSIIGIFLLAGFNAIPEELLEYGRLEARNWWRYLWHVALPLNRRVAMLAIAIALTITYLDFVSMYVETGSEVTFPMIGTLAYLDLILGGKTAYSAALIVTQLPLAFGLAALVLHYVERESPARVAAVASSERWGAPHHAPPSDGGGRPPSPAPRARPRWQRRLNRRVVTLLGLAAALLVFSFHIFPVYYTAIQSIRPLSEYHLGQIFWAFHPYWNNVLGELHDALLLLWLRNTLIVYGAVIVVGLTLSLMGGYGLARYRPPGTRWLARLMFCMYFVPQMAVILPLYHVYSVVHLDDTLVGIVLVYLTMAMPFTTWLFYSFFLGLDREVEEHAWLDGSRVQVFLRIVLPMSWPVVIAAALFSVGVIGSDVLYASIFSLSKGTTTLTVGLGVTALDLGEWGSASAGIIVSAVPFIVACAVLGRYFVHGLRAALLEGA